MNLRDILNEVLSQSSHIRKANFANSSDVDDVQMVSIANRVADEYRDYFAWPALRVEYSIQIQDGVDRYPMPEDYDGLVPDSVFEDSDTKVEIPTTDRRWYAYKYGDAPSSVIHARMYGHEMQVQDPVAGATIRMEYRTKWVVVASNGARKERFTDDTDTFLLDDQVLIRGIQAHWAETKLLPQAAAWGDRYRRILNQNIGQRVGAKTITSGDHRIGNAPYAPEYRR